MAFTLDMVVPWGRSFEEYRRMFALDDTDRQLKILGCGDGPASFNTEATALGWSIVSCDPLYRFDAGEIRARVHETSGQILDQTYRNRDEFVWDMVGSIEELGRMRLLAMDKFLADFERGKVQGRYMNASLPSLPFADRAFDLALCSHFLFLYSEQLTEAFHLESIDEMCRVAREVRIFPLLQLGSTQSPHVDPVMESLGRRGLTVSVEKVAYEFQRGGNWMMRISVPE
jgi:hypothetical protein